jgi:hypothetical protein
MNWAMTAAEQIIAVETAAAAGGMGRRSMEGTGSGDPITEIAKHSAAEQL